MKEGQRKGSRSATLEEHFVLGKENRKPFGRLHSTWLMAYGRAGRRLPVLRSPPFIASYCGGQVAMLRRVERTGKLHRDPRLWYLILLLFLLEILFVLQADLLGR